MFGFQLVDPRRLSGHPVLLWLKHLSMKGVDSANLYDPAPSENLSRSILLPKSHSGSPTVPKMVCSPWRLTMREEVRRQCNA